MKQLLQLIILAAIAALVWFAAFTVRDHYLQMVQQAGVTEPRITVIQPIQGESVIRDVVVTPPPPTATTLQRQPEGAAVPTYDSPDFDSAGSIGGSDQ